MNENNNRYANNNELNLTHPQRRQQEVYNNPKEIEEAHKSNPTEYRMKGIDENPPFPVSRQSACPYDAQYWGPRELVPRFLVPTNDVA